MSDGSDSLKCHTESTGPSPYGSATRGIITSGVNKPRPFSTTSFRPNYTTAAATPSQSSLFQGVPITASLIRDTPHHTPIRPTVGMERAITRGRGLSRSLSVPSLFRKTISVKNNDKESINDELKSPESIDVEDARNNTAISRHDGSSVKHLTCFWWKEKGTCRFSDEDCLYAHYDTGHYTDPPRQLIPGEPALAGRKLDRAMRNLAIAAHQSSGSISTTPGSRHGSRPSTPVLHPDSGPGSNISFTSPLSPPVMVMPQFNTDLDLARLTSDNQFLRTLVDQNGKEKAIMISTIEGLQSDNKGMKGELDGLRKAQEQLLVEREGLHKRIKMLEEGQLHTLGSSRSVSNPFGAIGRGRMNTEARYLGGLLDED